MSKKERNLKELKDQFKPKLTPAKAKEIANNIYYRTNEFKITNKEKILVENIIKFGLRYKDEYNDMIKLAVKLNLI